MKSKIGVNFMVTVGRALDTGENALAKLLQASQDMVSQWFHLILTSGRPIECKLQLKS